MDSIQVTGPKNILTCDQREHSFRIVTDEKTLLFSCNTPIELVTWINQIVRACQPKLKPSPLIPIKNDKRQTIDFTNYNAHNQDSVEEMTKDMISFESADVLYFKESQIQETFEHVSIQRECIECGEYVLGDGYDISREVFDKWTQQGYMPPTYFQTNIGYVHNLYKQ